jgi:hypothetical protein
MNFEGTNLLNFRKFHDTASSAATRPLGEDISAHDLTTLLEMVLQSLQNICTSAFKTFRVEVCSSTQHV